MSIEIKNDGTVTRQTIPNDPRNPSLLRVDGVYDYPPDQEFALPECGLYDADAAVVGLFRDSIGFDIKEVYAQSKMVKIDKPQVIFTGGERFALTKKKSPPVDRTKKLLMPSINIIKKNITFSVEEQNRGMSDKSGNIVIKRKLSDEFDRDYQSIINKLGLKHLTGFPTSESEINAIVDESAQEGTVDPVIKEGGLLQPLIKNNVYEILYIPSPKFFISTYEVTFWTSHISHMNYMMETLYSSMLAQEKAFKLVTPAGYWFMGIFDDEIQNGSNFEDYKEEQRIVQYTFTMKVKGFILPAQRGTNAHPVRRWVFAPKLNLDIVPLDKRPFNKEKLKAQQSVANAITTIPDNGDGVALFSLGEETSSEDMKQSEDKTLLYEQGGLYVQQKQRYDRRDETVTQFSKKSDWEQFKMAAYNEKRKRLGR